MRKPLFVISTGLTLVTVVVGAVLSHVTSPDQPNPEPQATTKAARQDCLIPDQQIQAGNILGDAQRLVYRGYVIQKVHKKVKEEVPAENGASPFIDIYYAAIKQRGRVIAKFDGRVHFVLGNSATMGFFTFLTVGGKQLILSQDAPKSGRQWVVDFSKGVNVIFDGQKFDVGRESYDMTISDLDGDGNYEIMVPITNFYGFQSWRLTTSETPLPVIIFRYEADKREYLPVNPVFKQCLLKEIVEAENRLRSSKKEPLRLGDVMSVVLDYVFVGEEGRAWSLFEEICKLPDKAKIKADMQEELNRHPVYHYIYKQSDSR